MIVLTPDYLPSEYSDGPVSPLNAVWLGKIQRATPLPDMGHITLIYPVSSVPIVCGEALLESDEYLIILPNTPGQFSQLHPVRSVHVPQRVLVILLSPGFVTEMASFLNIPVDMQALLSGTPLPQGDVLSETLQMLVRTLDEARDSEAWFMEVVGQILHRLKLKHQALLALNDRRDSTIYDLLPRLMQARQFIEANHLDPITTQIVAKHVLLSQYHFARLFKVAFGVTVHQYVMRLRLAEARHLLEEGEESVTEIALTVGYHSLSAFIHAFGKHCGLSPSAYREQMRSQKS
jgi:AraC-like DNA-binding protein